MQLFSQLPALLNVSIAFALILIINRLHVHLSLALFLGAITLGVLMGLDPETILNGIWHGLTDVMLLYLLLIVALILVLSRLMRESGQLDRIVTSFAGITGNVRWAAAVMPGLIGLLPMPGGALFSAPMVDAASKSSEIGPDLKTALNYWFRHVWEYWWPLYPGVILAVSLLGVKSWHFILLEFPLSIFALLVGYIFLSRLIAANGSDEKAGDKSGIWNGFLKEVMPILLVVLTIPLVSIFEIVTGVDLPKLSAVFIGLGVCLVWVIVSNRLPGKQVAQAVLDKSILPMIFLILGIMVFKGMLLESHAVAKIHTELTAYGIPPLIVVLLVPFLSGFITGIAVAFVGASFPLVVPLISQYTGLEFMAYAMAAYAFGFMGVMLSPVHLCLLVSRDYYRSSLIKSYGLILKPAFLFMFLVICYFLLLFTLSNMPAGPN